MMFLLLKAVPVMRGWEDVRDEMGREPIRKLQPQSLVPQVAESMLTYSYFSTWSALPFPLQI
jgi:hypothetical protein